MFNNKFKKLLLASSILVATGAANAGYEIKLSEEDKVAFGGYIKIDARHINGDVAYQDAWYGAGLAGTLTESKSQTRMFANESRFNMKYTHGEVMGFIELDFFGGGGNEIVSNSIHPRLRHAFIKYDNFLVGQTWSTLMNTSAIPETLDFAGPVNGGVFVRQAQVRYTNGGLQLSLENPESDKGDASEDSIPDFIAKYTFKGDWGNVSVAGLARQLNTTTGESESSIGYSIAGRINASGKNDLRFQYSGGEVGRYVGVVSGRDLVGTEVEETDSYSVAYRHFLTEDLRANVAYGHAKADISGLESTQISINVMKSLTKQLTVGVEVGNYEANNNDDRRDVDSDYVQLSLKYVL